MLILFYLVLTLSCTENISLDFVDRNLNCTVVEIEQGRAKD